MEEFRIDCSNVETPDQFWREYVLAVGSAACRDFGRNLDAFNDALSGGPGFPGHGSTVRLLHSAALERIEAGAFFSSLQDIASDSLNRAVTVVFE
jgi:hypothetical protein